MNYLIDVEHLLETTSYPAFLLRRDHSILRVNQAFCEFFGVKKEEVEGRFCYEFVHHLEVLPKFCPLNEDSDYSCPFSGCSEVCKEGETPPCCPLSEEDKEATPRDRKNRFYNKTFFEPRLKKFLTVTLIPVITPEKRLFGWIHFIEDRTSEKELDELLKATIDLYPGLFFINDETFRILYANEQAKRFFEMKSPICYRSLRGRDTPCPDCPLLLETEETTKKDLIYSEILQKYFQRVFHLVETKEGRVFKITFYHDVTEIVRLFEENPQALIITNPEGEILKANRRARELFKVPEKEIANINASFFWTNPEDRQKFLAELLAKGEIKSFEATLRDFYSHPFSALISSKVFPSEGKKLIYTSFEDVTEYLEIKREAYSFFETMVNLLPYGLALLTEEGKTLYVNHALSNLTGYTREELLGTNLHRLLTPTEELKKHAEGAFAKLREGGITPLAKKRVQVELRRKDGTLVPIEVVFDVVSFFGQRCFLGLISDITERLILEEKTLKEARSEAILKLSSGLAHDLNNLIMVAKGYLDLLQHKLLNQGPEVLPYLQKINAAYDSIARRISELFILSGSDLPKFMEIELSKFLPEWVAFYLQGSEVYFQVEVEKDLKVLMENRHLQTIIQNLVLNAKEAMEGQGELKVTAFKEGDWIVFRFEDTGPGIPPEILPKIFEPGFTTKPHGTGIGLTVIKRIVDLYNGMISVENRKGGGTVFTIKLQPRMVKITPSDLERIKGLTRFKGKRILILDDEEEIRELIKDFLVERGFEVETFPEGDSAYEAYVKALNLGKPFDFLLLDLTVPLGKGGVYFLEKIAGEGKLPPQIKVALMTGFTSQELAERAKNVRYDLVFYKPFQLEDLLAVLEAS